MATYYRPNLTEAERDWLIGIIRTEAQKHQIMSDDFEATFELLTKLKKCKPISTDKKN
jgi:hypothetical protein